MISVVGMTNYNRPRSAFSLEEILNSGSGRPVRVATHHNNFILVCSTFYFRDVFSFYSGAVFFNHAADRSALVAIVTKNTKKGFARPRERFMINSVFSPLVRFR
ncbi:hypothetical protein PUN28_003274 [Cardiocondyla obscurior]|uniref:Uncharacterized protein n=1 Tax=Cardiocondyla obscurior TaxID=286306 RepID=A0AAW2GI51_9HYME